MRFRIDLKIFLFLILFYLTRQIETYALMMLFAILHELGHLIAGLLLGMKPEKLELIPLGLTVSFRLNTKDYNRRIKKGNVLEVKKMVVAIAGPMTNVFLMLFLMYLPMDVFMKLFILYANILIILFNLLPIYPLDGGRILKGILHIYYGLTRARKYSHHISMVITMVLTAIASIAILYFENIAIFFIILYLWMMVFQENKRFRQKEKLYQMIEKTIQAEAEEKQIENMETSIEKNSI